MLWYAIVFISGGAVLALELLASRILTPYFGVSLFIWTGILSITLLALALGYWTGGRLAASPSARADVGRLAQRFASMPVLAALAITAACLAYPQLFRSFAAADLVLGAFAACLTLLFVPLVALSAMSPLLVSIQLARDGSRAAGVGTGMVFFVGTLGSVVGVLVTALGLIPYLTNFSATLWVALALALLSATAAVRLPAPLRGRRGLALAAAGATALAALLLWQADAYLERLWPAEYGGASWRVEARFGSRFGTVKILRSAPDPGGGFARIYFQDGLIQNSVSSEGRSLQFYTYALEALAYAYRPQLRSALVLGLGAGIVPMRLARQGVAVEVVEVDPASLAAATRFFGFDAERVPVQLADARTQLARCSRSYEVILVDLFHGDGTPEHLLTRDFFADLRRCLEPDGVAIFNTIAVLERPVAYAHLLVTLRAELPHLVLYRPDWPGLPHLNSFIVASAAPLPIPRQVNLDTLPLQHARTLPAMLAHPQALRPELLEGGEIVTDARSPAVHDVAESQLSYRRALIGSLPPAFLVD